MGKIAVADVDDRQQHLEALQHANRVRLARAQLKREIAAGRASVAEVILTNPWYAHTMKIFDLLRSQKRWGDTRCRRFLLSTNISENKLLETLTERQRFMLVSMLNQSGVYAPEQEVSRPATAHRAAAAPGAHLSREGALTAA